MNKSAFIDWYKWTSIENLYFVFKGLSLLTAEIIKKKYSLSYLPSLNLERLKL